MSLSLHTHPVATLGPRSVKKFGKLLTCRNRSATFNGLEASRNSQFEFVRRRKRTYDGTKVRLRSRLSLPLILEISTVSTSDVESVTSGRSIKSSGGNDDINGVLSTIDRLHSSLGDLSDGRIDQLNIGTIQRFAVTGIDDDLSIEQSCQYDARSDTTRAKSKRRSNRPRQSEQREGSNNSLVCNR